MAKQCPYCDVTFPGTKGLYQHIFKAHHADIIASLNRIYKDVKSPVPPFTITVPKYKKPWIVCLCCNEIWCKPQSYNTHVEQSKGRCAATNQIIAIQEATGLKFNIKDDLASPELKSLSKSNANIIAKLNKLLEKVAAQDKIIEKLQKENDEVVAYIFRLHPSVILPWVKEKPVASPPPPPPPPPPPSVKAIVTPPVVLPNQIDDSKDDDDDDDDDYVLQPEPEPEPVKLKSKFRCTYAPNLCSEIGSDIDNGVWFDPCKACKKNVCCVCVSKRGSRNKLHWYCSPECFKTRPKQPEN